MVAIWYKCPNPDCGEQYKTKGHICKGKGKRRHDPEICKRVPYEGSVDTIFGKIKL